MFGCQTLHRLPIKRPSWAKRSLWNFKNWWGTKTQHITQSFFWFRFFTPSLPPHPPNPWEATLQGLSFESYYAPVSLLIFHPHCIKYWYWFLVNGGEMDGSRFFFCYCSAALVGNLLWPRVCWGLPVLCPPSWWSMLTWLTKHVPLKRPLTRGTNREESV